MNHLLAIGGSLQASCVEGLKRPPKVLDKSFPICLSATMQAGSPWSLVDNMIGRKSLEIYPAHILRPGPKTKAE